ncbi:ATP-binding protein [Burkholderia sp. BCC0044]|uniref:ATP-binding protein n=1 Tax=Burkholderia sp. BCC0044 TaxID=2676295 RepID=UPI00158E7FF2|nr:ATP-binding protein [Burkholderia sp. BCC0044]
MKFQVQKLAIGEKLIEVSHPVAGDDNVFTMLVGKNAVGKTRALCKIVNAFVFPHRDAGPRKEVITSFDSGEVPRRVIAISNSRFDKFPDPDILLRKKDFPGSEYHYFGLGGIRSVPTRALSKGFSLLFGNEDKFGSKFWLLGSILQYVGFRPHIQIEFTPSFRESKADGMTVEDLFYQHINESELYRSGGEDANLELQELYESMVYWERRFKKERAASFMFDLLREKWFSDEEQEFNRHVPALLKSGFLRIARLNLFEKSSKNKIPFQQASSGQQCMLLMFIGLAGAIKDNSLICIDEPEICLHPRWQAEFIGIIQEAFSRYRGCHFLIATHSPQVVAGLSSDNGFVSDLEKGILLHAREYARKSADFQLTEIFHEPGFKNEYIIRVLISVISKLTNGQKLSSEDLQKLQSIAAVEERIDESDPVRHLLHQARMLAQ